MAAFQDGSARIQTQNLTALTCVVVEELDVSVLLRRDGDGQRGVTQHLVDLAGSLCEERQQCQSSLTIREVQAGTHSFVCDRSGGREGGLPGGPAESSFRTSCCVSMLKSPMWPLSKDVTM